MNSGPGQAGSGRAAGVEQELSEADDAVESRAHRIERSRPYRVLVGVDLVGYGLIHLLVAAIAIQLAWFGGHDQASSAGAMQQLARTPVGPPVLVGIVIGLVPIAGWQLVAALWGFPGLDIAPRTRRRFAAAGRVILYLVLAVEAIRFLTGARAAGKRPEDTLTARLLRLPFGPELVLVVAVAVAAVGVGLLVKCCRQTFIRNLAGDVSAAVRRLAQIGYAAEAVALWVVAALFAWAGLTADPRHAGGLDAALLTIRGAPFGRVLLTLMAAGLSCFGLYCFAWARHPRRH